MTPIQNKSGSCAALSFILKLCILFFLILPSSLLAQSYDSLNQLSGYKTKTYYSDGSLEQAKTMTQRCDNVLAFYTKHIAFEPSVTLLVLSPKDWSKYTNFPFYGMPHYDDKKTLIVASEDNAFWKSFNPEVEKLPKELAKQILNTYSDKNGNLSMKPFFDLLAVHELGHAYHFQGGLIMQRKWMGELFPNVLLHTYIAENEKDLLPALTLFPQMVVSSTKKTELKYTTLSELEINYNELGQKYPQNYGWYQCRWHMAAGNIYDAGGVDALKKLWFTLKTQREILDDASFANLLALNAHQSVADVLIKWDE